MDNNIFERARMAAIRSQCKASARYGAVCLSAGGAVLSEESNKPIAGFLCRTDCSIIRSDVPSHTAIERCYAIHAEWAAILAAGRHIGRIAIIVVAKVLEAGELDFMDVFPCTVCARIMLAAGVKHVWLWNGYWKEHPISDIVTQSYDYVRSHA